MNTNNYVTDSQEGLPIFGVQSPQAGNTISGAQVDTLIILTYTVDSTLPTDGVEYTMTTTDTPMYVDGTYNPDSKGVPDTDEGKKELPYPGGKVEENEETNTGTTK